MIARVAQALNRKDGDKGFTLVELLVVVIIIGILAAIAVPVYLNQRTKAYDARLVSDLRNAGRTVLVEAGERGWDGIKAASGITGTTATLYVAKGTWEGLPTGVTLRMWNDYPELDPITISDNARMIIGHIAVPTGTHPKAHEADHFCIAGSSEGSRWDRPYGTGAATYDRSLYFDSKLGAVVTLQEVAEAEDAGQDPSCGYYIAPFLAAGGTL